MNKDSNKTGNPQSDHGGGTRPRHPYESNYGYPNREDGIQSIHSGDGDPLDPLKPKAAEIAESGPGATHSNGMKGQT